MSVHRKGSKWVVRYRDGAGNRSRSFDRKQDADRFDAEVTRRRQLGALGSLDAGQETLDEFVTEVWAPTHGVTLAPKTRKNYAGLYDHHIAPVLGGLRLRDIKTETIARWQAERLAAGSGPVAVRQALDLLSSILQKAYESERIAVNPARRVRKARLPRRAEVRPLAPSTIEAMRAGADLRDATLFSVLAYAGLRPGEALALQWGDVRENTLLVERALSLGAEEDTKTPPIGRSGCSRRCARTSPSGAWRAAGRRTVPSCSPTTSASLGPSPLTNPGAADRSSAPSTRPASQRPRPTRCATASPRCSSTRAAA